MKLVIERDVPVEMDTARVAEWMKLMDALGMDDVGEQQPFCAGPGGWPPALGIPGAPRGFRCLQGDGVRVFALWSVFYAFVWDGRHACDCAGADALSLVRNVVSTMESRGRRDARDGTVAPAFRGSVLARFQQAMARMEAGQ